jgi:hypothetical protein
MVDARFGSASLVQDELEADLMMIRSTRGITTEIGELRTYSQVAQSQTLW